MSCPLCGLPPDLCTCKQKAREKRARTWHDLENMRSAREKKAEPRWLSKLLNPYIIPQTPPKFYCRICDQVLYSRRMLSRHLKYVHNLEPKDYEGQLVSNAARVARHTTSCENLTKYGMCQVTGLECSIISKDCIFRKQRKPRKKRKTKKKPPLTKDPRINAFLDTLD